MLGPIDYIIVGFEGDVFDGSVLQALETAIDNNTINLVALSLISKDTSGTVAVFDTTNTDEYMAGFLKKYPLNSGAITQEDIDEVSELLQNNTSAGLLVIEQVWAKPLKQALLNANGTLIAEGRIHPDAAEELSQTKEQSHARIT